MPIDKKKYMKLFLSEVDEQLVALNSLLVKLEKDREDMTVINEIFRITHTIKGNASAMGFDRVSEFAHTIEDVFDLLRKKKLTFTADIANVVFIAIDELKKMLHQIQRTGRESEGLPEVGTVLHKIALGESNWKLEKSHFEERIEISDVARVPMRKLDNLINLIGEMLINISRLEVISHKVNNKSLRDIIPYLRHIVSDFQYIVMDARLVPLSSIFDQLPRMVRDIAQQEGKSVALSVEGADIQLDSKVVERIKTPVIQIIRNAISHGIEAPAERKKIGKDETGNVKISALRDKDRVCVLISDDGRGMDAEEIARVAISLGIVSEDMAEYMSEDEMLALIFEPGFTTASETGQISGRGVGMDAVRTELASIGASIAVQSTPKKGTTFKIVAPISIAIVKSLLCEVRGNVYAFPITNVQAIRNVPQKELHRMNGEHTFSFEDELVPVLSVESLLFNTKTNLTKKGEWDVVIVNTMNRLVGFAVDGLLREDDLVVKSIDVPTFSGGGVRSVSGASLLGDGSVALILDPNEMIKQASLRRTSDDR